jgi:anhydro-N-acetylmuramic acid kinase
MIFKIKFKKNKKIAIGLMSGTSADGIDAALVEISGTGMTTKYRLLGFHTYPYPQGFRDFLLRNSSASTARIDDITRCDILVAKFFADAARRLVRENGLSLTKIDFIGSHGQTIHHLPQPHFMYGNKIRSTLQIGHPSAIAKFTGVLTIGDFRVGDIAVGGSGAPLVPLFDYLTLRSPTRNRAALNIGGIANITVLPRHCRQNQVLAFDTGPGNIVIDRLVKKYFHVPYDRDGRIASSGKLLTKLLRWMISDPYFKLPPPKSTGREIFGNHFIQEITRHAQHASHIDLITTVTEFTALSIFQSYCRYIRPRCRISEMFVSGGGVHNLYLMEALQKYFEGIAVRTTTDANIPPDAKEAICFALLANETLAGNTGNIPRATGAVKKTLLGVIALP